MKQFINNFCSNNLKNFNVEIQDFSNYIVNSYVEKCNNSYKITININTLQKMNFNEKDLECLLFHEKGHYELKHLEVKNNFLVNSILGFFFMLLSIFSLIMRFFMEFNFLFIALPLFMSFYLIYDNLKYLNNMRKAEMQADKYACIYCDKKDYVSMLYKLENFYSPYSNEKNKLLIFLETHPSSDKRIKAI